MGFFSRASDRALAELDAEIERISESGLSEFTVTVRRSSFGGDIGRTMQIATSHLQRRQIAVISTFAEPWTGAATLVVRLPQPVAADPNPTKQQAASVKPIAGVDVFTLERFPNTPYSAPDNPDSDEEQKPWLKLAVDASYWRESGDHFLAVRAAMAGVGLAPPDELPMAARNAGNTLYSLAHDRGSAPGADILAFLTKIVEWLLPQGWLDQAWANPLQAPSPEADAAWYLFPVAVIGLLRTAADIDRSDVIAHYRPIAVARLQPMTEVLPAWVGNWVKLAVADSSKVP